MPDPIGKNQYGDDIYQTPNGQKTGTQITQELAAANWDGAGDPVAVYNSTAAAAQGGGGSQSAPSTSGSSAPQQPSGGSQQQYGYNPQAAQLAAQVADNAAQQAYLQSRLNLDSEIEANRKAQQVWQNTFDQARFDYQKQLDTQQFGLNQAAITGTYNGAPTEKALEFQAQQGLAQQHEANTASLGYLNLIGGLRGPQDYGSYLRVLGSTPGGLRDLVAASAGKYVPAAGATTGIAPDPATLGGLVNSAVSGTSGGTSYADYQNATSGLVAPNQISPDAWNNFTSSQKQMLLGAYGQQGYDTNDVLDLYKQSLPSYKGPAGTVKF